MNDKTIPPKRADPAKKSGTDRKDRLAEQLRANLMTVSYTHLTLPTNREV